MLLNCGVEEDCGIVVLKKTVLSKKTLESPLDWKETQPVHPKGNQSWIFIERTDAEAETSILWPPVAKSWLLWKDPDAGKGWRQEEKGMTEDEMVGWHHQGSPAYCSPWCRKESDMTEWPNSPELNRWPEFMPPSLEELRILSHSDWRHPKRTHFIDENNEAWRCYVFLPPHHR